MSWQIDTITLPIVSKVTDKWETSTRMKDIPGTLPYYVAVGRRRVLNLEGYIYEAGKTKAYLETNYIIPLRNKVKSSVTLSAPDTRYDGTYLFNSFTYEESGRYGISFTFRIELIAYSTLVSL